jgi:hypothetical protein
VFVFIELEIQNGRRLNTVELGAIKSITGIKFNDKVRIDVITVKCELADEVKAKT